MYCVKLLLKDTIKGVDIVQLVGSDDHIMISVSFSNVPDKY